MGYQLRVVLENILEKTWGLAVSYTLVMGRRSPALGQARALDVGSQEAEGILSPLPAASFSLAALLPRRQARPLLGPDRRPGGRQCGPLCPATSLDWPAEAGRAVLQEDGGSFEARDESRNRPCPERGQCPSRQMTKQRCFHYLCVFLRSLLCFIFLILFL